MQARPAIVTLGLSPWASAAQEDRLWDDVFAPLLDRICEEPLHLGLMLGGRISERIAGSHGDGLRAALAEGRLELLASSLHSAPLASIPERDAIGQLNAHLTLLKRTLGARPTGCWLPRETWDPVFPRILRAAQLRWTVLDADWLERARVPRADRWMVEREGKAVLVVPGGDRGAHLLRPREQSEVAPTLEVLRQASPLARLREGLATRAYLPSGGPRGMWENALLADEGALCLHQRMIATSGLVHRLERAVDRSSHSDEGPDPRLLAQARRYLYRCQAAEAYEGDRASRRGGWRDVARAEDTVLEGLGGASVAADRLDEDHDGTEEVRIRSARWCVTVVPQTGGVLREIGHRPSSTHLLTGAVPVAFRESWGQGHPVAGVWELITADVQDDSARVMLGADSTLAGEAVRLTKSIHADNGPLMVRIELQHRGRNAARGRLSTELFLSVQGAHGWRFDGRTAGREAPAVSEVRVEGAHQNVVVQLRPAAFVSGELLADDLVRLEFSWPVELFNRDRERREISLDVLEVSDG